MPMFILEDKDGGQFPIVIGDGFSGDEGKDAAKEFVIEKIKEFEAVRLGFISEAWVIEAKHPGMDVKTRPSEHEDRREIVQYYVEDKSGFSKLAYSYILRPEHGEPKLSPVKTLGDDWTRQEGRFVGWFS